MAESEPAAGEKVPMLKPHEPEATEEWQTGLFDCLEDCHLSAVGLFCPQCLHADNATRLDRFASCGPYQCSYICLHVLLLCTLVGGHHRRELRRTFALPEKPCGDFLVHCFCSLCALCQEAREIKRRSAVHPAPRLAAALERRGQPPEVQRMTRTYSHGLALEDWEWDSESGTVGVVRTKSRNLSGANVPGIAKAKAIRRTTTSLQDSGSLRGSVEPASPLSGRAERSWIGRVSDLDGKAAESAVAAENQAAKVDNEPEGAAAPEPASAPGAAVPATRSFNFMSPFDGPDTAPPAAAASQRQLGRAVSFARATASSSGRGTELSGLSEAELDSLASRVSLDMAAAARAAAQRIIAVDRQSHSYFQHRLNQLKEDEASGDN